MYQALFEEFCPSLRINIWCYPTSRVFSISCVQYFGEWFGVYYWFIVEIYLHTYQGLWFLTSQQIYFFIFSLHHNVPRMGLGTLHFMSFCLRELINFCILILSFPFFDMKTWRLGEMVKDPSLLVNKAQMSTK